MTELVHVAYADTTGKLVPITAANPLPTSASGGSGGAVAGDVAAGAADSGNPVKVGGKFVSAGVVLTNGQRGDLMLSSFGAALMAPTLTAQAGADGLGNTITAPGAQTSTGTALYTGVRPQNFNGTTWDRARGDTNGTVVQPGLSSTFWNYAAASGGITDTADVAVKAAAGASVRNFVSAIQYHNTAAVASEIVVKDGATVLWRGYAPASMTHPANVTFPVPLKGTANTAVNVAMITTATATRVNVQGFTGS